MIYVVALPCRLLINSLQHSQVPILGSSEEKNFEGPGCKGEVEKIGFFFETKNSLPLPSGIFVGATVLALLFRAPPGLEAPHVAPGPAVTWRRRMPQVGRSSSGK